MINNDKITVPICTMYITIPFFKAFNFKHILSICFEVERKLHLFQSLALVQHLNLN